MDWSEFAKQNFGGDPERIQDAVRAVLTKLDWVYPTKLVKLLYLAEVAHIQKTGERLTGARFKSDLYGPNSPEVHVVVESMTDDELEVGKSKSARGHEMTFLKPRQRPMATHVLTLDERRTIRDVVEAWGYAAHDKLVAASKRTHPYVDVKKGEWLPLDDYAEECRRILEWPGLREEIVSGLAEAEDADNLTTYATPKDFVARLFS